MPEYYLFHFLLGHAPVVLMNNALFVAVSDNLRNAKTLSLFKQSIDFRINSWHKCPKTNQSPEM